MIYRYIQAYRLSLSTFGLTIHTGSKRKGEDSKTEAIHSRPGQESSAADMEDIEIDADRFMSFASSSNT
jgi:hypothetical protein